MTHPFKTMSKTTRARLFWTVLILNFVTQAALVYTGRYLQTDAAPAGIVSYEFAGDAATANAIIASWEENRGHAWANLLIDFPFMVFYSCSIAIACIWAGEVLEARRWRIHGLSVILAWLQWGAALLDAIENAGLIAFMSGGAQDPWPMVVWACAAIKFALVGLGLLYAALGFAVWLSTSAPPTAPESA